MPENKFYDFKDLETVEPLFTALENCKGVEQRVDYHPEGDVLNHSLQVFHRAIRESTDIDLLVAALFHDVGKAVESYGHENIALEILHGYISEKTSWLIENHMRYWKFVFGKMKKRSKVLLIWNNKWFHELAFLGRWDEMGRNPNQKIEYDRNKIIDTFIKIS